MSTLCLSDLGELRDEWLREPGKAAPSGGSHDQPTLATASASVMSARLANPSATALPGAATAANKP